MYKNSAVNLDSTDTLFYSYSPFHLFVPLFPFIYLFFFMITLTYNLFAHTIYSILPDDQI